jgi:hypothetical protein
MTSVFSKHFLLLKVNIFFFFFTSFPGMCGKISRSNSTLGVMLFARLARGPALRLRYTDAELRALKEP